MPHAYTEDQLVEQPAIGLFVELGWSTVSALEETFGAPAPGLAASPVALTRPSATLSRPTGEGQLVEGASLGRETKGEVVLVSRLRAALERLNPALPPEAITARIQNLRRTRDLLLPRLLSGQVELATGKVVSWQMPVSTSAETALNNETRACQFH